MDILEILVATEEESKRWSEILSQNGVKASVVVVDARNSTYSDMKTPVAITRDCTYQGEEEIMSLISRAK